MSISERKPLTTIYPQEIVAAFPTFETEVAAFLERNAGKVATLNTPTFQMVQYAKELQDLARILASGIQRSKLNFVELYLKATQPAREAGPKGPRDEGQLGLILGKHKYHILERVQLERENSPSLARSLLLLLQRIPHGVDSGAEVHGIKKDTTEKWVPDEIGGIEVYLPLVNGIRFHVNDHTFEPQALEGLITILPGDSHHHIKEVGSGPTRLMLLGGFGFSRAPKTEERFEVDEFAKIPRYIPLT